MTYEWAHNVVVLARRNLVHVRRDLAQLADVTAQPIVLTLLFTQLFGGSIVVAGGSYTEFAIAGSLVMNLATSAPTGTAVGLAVDARTGIIDRFRTLAMRPTAIVAGRTASDLLACVLSAACTIAAGLVVGWRVHSDIGGFLAGIAIALLFGYALTWFGACLGLAVKGPESARAVGLMILFPLTFVSNAFVPADNLPGVLATAAAWNPVSAVAAAARELWGNPNPSAAISAWPMQHPVAAAVIWSLVILGVCATTATWLFRRRTIS